LRTKERKGDLDAAAGRVEPRDQRLDEPPQTRHCQRLRTRQRALLEQLDEARHMRALLRLGQRHVDVARRDRRLRRRVAVGKRQRVAQSLDADALDGDAALVALCLHVGNRDQSAWGFGSVHRPSLPYRLGGLGRRPRPFNLLDATPGPCVSRRA
jgi:hypothetical protein